MLREALESVICDVMKKRLQGGMKGEVGKETPKKEMDEPSLLDT